MLTIQDVLETNQMIQKNNLDVRTITMGISLLDCCASDGKTLCNNIYDKITKYGEHLVETGEAISREYGVPIINKRVSVTPISLVAGASDLTSYVDVARTLDKAAKEIGINFIGGFSALVERGMSKGDRILIDSIAESLAVTDLVCSSVAVGSTKAGINMDAVAEMGRVFKDLAERTKDQDALGCAKLVVFSNAVEDNPFMAGAFHGVTNGDSCISVGVSGPGVVKVALEQVKGQPFDVVAETIKKTAFKITRVGQLVAMEASKRLNMPFGLRAFEKEMGVEVIRPDIAGLMGAYGAALFGLRQCRKNGQTASAMMSEEELESFDQKVVSVKCGGCGNHCQLTVNTFADGRKFISGNRCDKPVTGKSEDNSLNLYAYKQQLLASYKPVAGKRGSIGIPLCLNMYELLPFWHAFWTKLGFAVHTSPVSSRGLYLAGQATIPSDTACFPAKLSHGHIKALTQMHLDAIFYPCLTYNIDEGLGDNHYNCPVVAYYPEVLAGNCPELEGQKFIYDYVGIHRPKDFVHKMAKEVLPKYFGGISEKEVQEAANAAYAEYEAHMAQIRVKGSEIMDEARRQGRRIIVLAGRPYHVDPEINHGIDHLITHHGAAVVTEDSISNRVEKFPTSVLNQWTYHSRLYAAAKYCTTQKDMDLVQLVSFGCGVDAITTDETREILQEGGKLYTQLKIDEITNLGAVNIRLRSLFAALDERDEDKK